MLAGSDSTAIYLRAVLYYLLKNPPTLSKLLSELRTLEASHQTLGPITWKQTQSLTYLDACIKEAGRLHPVNSTLLERVVSETGLEVQGHFLPPGTVVGINPWVSHRDHELFGADADDWRPERWLTNEKTQLEWEKSTLTFGSGNRSCIGKHIAKLEIYKLIPELLKHFEIALVHPERDWTVEGFWVAKQKDMNVTLRRRNE
ncbi:cytochrome P450 [Truncatella angustata]|uniref:Cytochrome P450 n=1 Tax=Truncatella angustata TaxID=152316 RepID=A0A9P8UJD9_9PEZI|nr:cytochrome P450 [Truncatella angustata]KAH6653277.1 cytochrome P450 [Truncatella angustata]KAH8197774.1 hypothetical protein TruAng_008063 [Truncatella angustata]